MHPVAGMGLAAGIGVIATAAFLAILKISFVVTCMLIACSAAFGSAVARRAPRFAVIVVPVSALMTAHHDVFGISGWAIWRFFNDGPGGPTLGYVYQYLIFSFMIIGALIGLQRRHNGDRPFILSAQPLVFNGSFWQPSMTPMVGWWLLSTLIGVMVVALTPASFVTGTFLTAIHGVADWAWHDFLQFSMVFDFQHFCRLSELDGNSARIHCMNLLFNNGVVAYFTVYPIGIFWIIGFVVVYMALVVAGTFLPSRLQWLGMFWFLAGPAIPLFVLTTTYGLPLFYWGTYVAWGIYAAFVVRTLWRWYRGGGRAGLRSGLRWGVVLLLALFLASDIDWVLKQRLERNLFGVFDGTAEYEADEGRPRLAWGGVPRLILGLSPTDRLVEQAIHLFDRGDVAGRSRGASTPGATPGRSGVIPEAGASPPSAAPSAGTGQERAGGVSLPLPPPPAPPSPPRSSETTSVSRPAGSAAGETASPPRPATPTRAAAQGVLGQPKDPPPR